VSKQVGVNIIHAGVGPISQSDVDLAEACGACVVGFNVRSMAAAVGAAARRAKINVSSLSYECLVGHTFLIF
jgi:translation initiation factor IF-2